MSLRTMILACFISCTLDASVHKTSCPQPGDAEWNEESIKMQCSSGTEFHCAKDRDLQFNEQKPMFIMACAKVENCSAGQEPLISLNEQNLTNKVAKVYCEYCRHQNQYNSQDSTASNTITNCPEYKQPCTNNKIKCPNDTYTEDRKCRCDARRSWKPNENVTQCFEESWIYCIYDPCPADTQMLLNYTCGQKCPENFMRTDDSDACVPAARTTSFPEIMSPSTSSATSSSSVISATEISSLTTSSHSPEGKPAHPDDNTLRIATTVSVAIVIIIVAIVIIIAIFLYHKYRVSLSTKWTGLCKKCFHQYQEHCGKNLKNGFSPKAEKDLESQQFLKPTTETYSNNGTPPALSSNEKSMINKVTYETNNYYGPFIHKSGKVVIYPSEVPHDDNGETDLAESLHNTTKELEAHDDIIQHSSDQSQQNTLVAPTSLRDRTWYHQVPDDEKDVFVEKVLKITNIILLKNMGPDYMLDSFENKNVLTTIEARDIRDKPTKTDQNRAIIEAVRNKGFSVYLEFKKYLHENGQYVAFQALQSSEDKLLKRKASESSDDAILLLNDRTHSKSDLEETVDLSSHDSSLARGACNPEQDPLLHKQEDSGVVIQHLNKLSEEKDFKSFQKTACQIEKDPEFQVILKLLRERNFSGHLKSPASYRNTPNGYIAYTTTGKENSCLYQCISLLLHGDDTLQYWLRLATTLHAADQNTFQSFKEKILQFRQTDEVVAFFAQYIDQTDEQPKTLADKVEQNLQKLIMETCKLGIDSSPLHVYFVSGAINRKINQFFQLNNPNPTLEQILSSSHDDNDPGLNIFWVSTDGKKMNHIVPLVLKV